jgi:hypothetical protein
MDQQKRRKMQDTALQHLEAAMVIADEIGDSETVLAAGQYLGNRLSRTSPKQIVNVDNAHWPVVLDNEQSGDLQFI